MSIKTCINHPNRLSNKQCTNCGDNLCKYCGVDYDGEVFCNSCRKIVNKTQRIIKF